MRWSWLFAALLVAGVALIARQVPTFGFVAFDDDHNIYLNPHLGPPSWPGVEWALTDWGYARRVMPLGWLGFSVVFGWAGLEPAGWHVVGVLLHAASALLLWVVLRTLLTSGETKTRAPRSAWVEASAFFGAAFWAWHPLRAESVGWASGLLYEQAHVFLFLAAWAWLRATSPRGRAVSVLLYAGSLLSYPVALGVAPMFGLLARWRGAAQRVRRCRLRASPARCSR